MLWKLDAKDTFDLFIIYTVFNFENGVEEQRYLKLFISLFVNFSVNNPLSKLTNVS